MDGKSTSGLDPTSMKLLLKEYEHLASSFLRNESMGENRANLFLIIAGAVLAGFGLKSGSFVSAGKVSSIVPYALVAVLIVGIVTLVRMVHRNIKTDEYLRALGRIRKWFTDRDQSEQLLQLLPFKPEPGRPCRQKRIWELFSFGKGGLVETIAVVNSIVAGGVAGLAWYSYVEMTGDAGRFGIAALATAWLAQHFYVACRYRKAKSGATRTEE